MPIPIRTIATVLLLAVGAMAQGAPVDLASSGDRRSPERLSEVGCITLVDFRAAWSPAGAVLSPELEALARTARGRIRFRKVLLEDWTAPILAQYRVRCLPFVLVFGEDGKLVARGLEGYRKARALLEAAQAPTPLPRFAGRSRPAPFSRGLLPLPVSVQAL